jgi:hypothetical protein
VGNIFGKKFKSQNIVPRPKGAEDFEGAQLDHLALLDLAGGPHGRSLLRRRATL